MKNKSIFNLKAFVFLFPTLLVFGMFLVWPLIYTVYLSFFKWNMISKNKVFVGFENYLTIFKDSSTKQILMNSFWYIFWIILFAVCLPYIMAFVLNYLLPKFIDAYKAILFVPAVMSLVVASVLFTWILNPISGPVALILRQVGISMPFWSNSEGWVIFVIALIVSWKVFGYNFILLFAAISGISKELIESAKMDNISNGRIFFKIILPISSATGIYVLIMAVVQALQYVFTPIAVLTQGGPDGASSNIIYESYRQGFEMFNTGRSAALSVITLLICVILLLIEYVFVERRVYYEN
ncbi:ABC transporter permease [Falseniella ignava]|uniref:ABC transporter permease n=1 Tax=Falseniella ignava TaxID=137730 RepID=A0A2I1K1V7_9LACT|nr:sugar ABC transporter permease [Falseniella ignava]PKY89644.1 ABC transporter permease [Falseniella ignava]